MSVIQGKQICLLRIPEITYIEISNFKLLEENTKSKVDDGSVFCG